MEKDKTWNETGLAGLQVTKRVTGSRKCGERKGLLSGRDSVVLKLARRGERDDTASE